jgi:hypothetical protein
MKIISAPFRSPSSVPPPVSPGWDFPSLIRLGGCPCEVDTEVTDVEHGGKPDYNDGADPYLRITGWLQR